MIRTPQYKLGFNQSGEPYSASNDLDRMVVVDNQLIDLSQISGDGVLTGWNISTDGTTVTVSPGSGFIDGILNRTYASKAKPIVDMATTKVYMQTNMNNTQDNPAIGQTQGLDLEMESPRSPIASATFLDAIPPAAPSDFVATLSDTVFNEIDLGWSKNTELDFDHYELQRGSSALGPWTTIATTTNLEFSDTGLTESTAYYYQIFAFDLTGNQSTASSLGPIVTPIDPDVPSEVSGLTAYFSDAKVTLVYNASSYGKLLCYLIKRETLALDGSVVSSHIINNDTAVTYQDIGSFVSALANHSRLAGVATIQTSVFHSLSVGDIVTVVDAGDASFSATAAVLSIPDAKSFTYSNPGIDTSSASTTGTVQPNNMIYLKNETSYRYTVISVSTSLVQSPGIAVETTPHASAAPADVTSVSLVPMDRAFTVSWTASASPTGSLAVGQKNSYNIRVIAAGVTSLPVPGIGLQLTTVLTSFSVPVSGGAGLISLFNKDTDYLFRISTLDAFGNESQGTYVKGRILDTTPPNNPRNLILTAGDTKVLATWRHSSSSDVVGYNLSLSINGGGYGSDIILNYINSYEIDGLTNGDSINVRIRARDSVGNLSSGITSLVPAMPQFNTIPPDIPTGLEASSSDSEINVAWNPSTANDLDHYVVRRLAVLQTTQNVNTLGLQSVVGTVSAILTHQRSAFISTLQTAFAHNLSVGDTVTIVDNVDPSFNATTQVLTVPSITSFTYSNFANDLVLAGTTGTVTPTGESIRKVGKATGFLDCGLRNFLSYAYYVKSVDTNGNESDYSSPVIQTPDPGLNELPAPTGLTAAANAGGIGLTWTFTSNAACPTNFNIYRSSDPTVNFSLMASIATSDPLCLTTDSYTWDDIECVGSIQYYYRISAVKDTAAIFLDTGSLLVPNSILLGEITTTLPTFTLTNVQRIIANLEATVGEETIAKILAHRHSLAAVNGTTVTALGLLSMIAGENLSSVDLTTLPLSVPAVQYYKNLVTSPVDGTPVKYDAGTTYFITPSNISGEVPFVGDFQVLVNGAIPTTEFSIDEDRNAVVFSTSQTGTITISGEGLTYYVPAELNLPNVGFAVYVNGAAPIEIPNVSSGLQTLTFLSPLDSTAVVTVVVEPAVPDFGNQIGVKQVNLSPNTILSDFQTGNYVLYASQSGKFEQGDIVFALVNGLRATQNYAIDFTDKTITFDNALSQTDVVSLEIVNREEVQNLLPSQQVTGLSASQFGSGTFILAQLPQISHEGRINERADPIFAELTTSDRYVYQAAAGSLGKATTPYSVYLFEDGKIMLGTSEGLLAADSFANFLSSDETATTSISHLFNVITGVQISGVLTDDVSILATEAAAYSGKLYKKLEIATTLSGGEPLITSEVTSPSIATMSDGRVLISGGEIYDSDKGFYLETTNTWIYDPVTKLMTQTGSLGQARSYHSMLLLPSGKIMAAGGLFTTNVVLGTEGNVVSATFQRLNTVEVFDPMSGTWSSLAPMNEVREAHSCNLISDNLVLVAGGYNANTSFDDRIGENPTEPTTGVSSEIYDILSNMWSPAADLNRARANQESSVIAGDVVVEGDSLPSELYDQADDKWILSGTTVQTAQASTSSGPQDQSFDGPTKILFVDSTGLTYAVTKNGIFVTSDRETFVTTKGLDFVQVVHAMTEGSDGTLFAATDVGVYEMPPPLKEQMTWQQGGLIGAGTNEVFSLQSFPHGYSSQMLAGTEIGLFSSSDDGGTWVDTGAEYQSVPLGNIFNIEAMGDTLFIQSGGSIYSSSDFGASWSKVGDFQFLDENSIFASISPFALFVGTGFGLYASTDGKSFFLVDFPRNNDINTNPVTMCVSAGGDVIVGYDNAVFSVDPNMNATMMAEWIGDAPTVRLNGEELRDGFRYDNAMSTVILEHKALTGSTLEATSNYGLYRLENGEWYSQNEDAPVIVFVNGMENDSATTSPRLGEISFTTPLSKGDAVTATVAMTTLSGAGELFHDELDNEFGMASEGLPFSLGQERAGSLLQMGISIEHNFWERGIERNQYCLFAGEVDRSLTSFLTNSDFFILGRREYDTFNSTIEYLLESQQPNSGFRALVPLSVYEFSSSAIWVGTDNGIFVLDPMTSFSLNGTMQVGPPANRILSIQPFNGTVWLATSAGVFNYNQSTMGFDKNPGLGLAGLPLTFSSLAGIAILGTDNGIYYSDDITGDGSYSIWYRAAYSDLTGAAVVTDAPCVALTSDAGQAYAAIGDSIFTSVDGKAWTKVFEYNVNGLTISAIAVFALKVFVGTNNGLYSDDGSIRSVTASFNLQTIDPDLGIVPINDVFPGSSTLYAVGYSGKVYEQQNGNWTSASIPNLSSISKSFETSQGVSLAFFNDSVFVNNI